MRVVILGADGQLGTDLCGEFASLVEELVPLTHRKLEICDHQRVADALTALSPQVVVNTAAFTNVEACEQDVERAFAVNCHAVLNLAKVCDQLDALLVHLSTDYVFDGDQGSPYRIEATPNPVNVYGASKAAGENFVGNWCRKHQIVRTSGLYGLAGSSGKGGNFVETMLRLGRERRSVSVVTDQVLSPTYTRDVARAVRALVEGQAQGVFHVTNSGSCSWYEFAAAIFELWDPKVEVLPVTSAEFGSNVRRPRYSVLDNHRLLEDGHGPLRPWREALEEYLDQSRERMRLETAAKG